MKNTLKVMWFGYGGNSCFAENLRPIVEQNLGMSLITIHEWDSANIKWDQSTWLTHLKEADIIVVPADPSRPAKSNNRLTQSLSLGKPVVCSSLPAYLDVQNKFPEAFFVADTLEEWREKLQMLRDSPELRESMGEKAMVAAQDYSIDAIGQKWLNILQKREPVDIIIPTYKNLRGIVHCIESIKTCTAIPYKIIVVNNGIDEELHQYLPSLPGITYIKTGQLNFAQAVNLGIKAGTGKYVCILNDDVIFSRGCLDEMVKACTDGIGAVGLLSNCDKGWLHNYDISVSGVNLLPGTNTFEEIEPIIPQIYNYRSSFTGLVEQDWVAFYCTMIPREVINKIGVLNEEYTNSGEDVDYCWRIRAHGYKIIQNYKAFCFHFGAVSRKLREKEDYDSYHDADKKTNTHLNRLWGRKSVTIYSGPMWHPWDFRNVDQGGIGGSETWQVMLAREFHKLNYRVTVFCDCPQPEVSDGDIEYLHYTKYNKWVEQHWTDYFISSRTTDPFNFPLRSGKNFVQVHDVFLLSHKDQIPLNNIEKYCVLSKWHWDFVKNYHNIPDSKIALTANGVDFDRYSLQNVEKYPHRMFWSSSLDRGLDTLLYLFDFIKAEIPDLELHVYYGMFNWEAAAKQRNDSSELKKIEEIKRGLEKPGVFYHGRMGQKELAVEQMKSSLWAYSSDFTETFCITAVEAQAAGCPVVASNYAGLQTTLGDSAILIGNGNPGQSYTKEYREEFVKKCVEILKNRELWQQWSHRGSENAKKYSWLNCALRWKSLFEGKI